MCAPSAPPPPDYAAAAKEQGAANLDVARYNNLSNRVDQFTPQGSSTWNLQSSVGADGMPVDHWSNTVSLSPEQQALYDSGNRISQNFLNTGEAGLQRVSDAMGQPISTQGLPALSWQANAPQMQTQLAGTPSVQTGVRGSGPLQTSVPQGQPLQGSVGSNLPIQSGLADAGGVQRGIGSGGRVQSSVGPLPGQQTQLNTSQLPALSGDPAAARAAVVKATLSRGQQDLGTQEGQLRNQLLNSGIEVGTSAWDNEMQRLDRSKNDLAMQAELAGSQIASQLEAQQLAQRQQAFGEASTEGQFTNTALGNLLQQKLAGGTFANTAQAQKFGQGVQAGQFANQAQAQQFQQNATEGQFANTAQAQDFTQQLQSGQFTNTASNQTFDRNLQAAQFGNTAIGQDLSQQLQEMVAGNSAQGQAFAQALQSGQFANTAIGQQLAQALQVSQQSNQTRSQGLQELAYLRSLPLNEVNALRTGSQVSMPNFNSYYTNNAAAAPIMDGAIAQGNYNAQMAAQQQSGLNSLMGGLANMGAAYIGMPV